jgi:hypothetical protein
MDGVTTLSPRIERSHRGPGGVPREPRSVGESDQAFARYIARYFGYPAPAADAGTTPFRRARARDPVAAPAIRRAA